MQHKEEKEEQLFQQRKQKKLFSTKSPQISLALLFTGLILMIAATISAPTVVAVYAANIQGTPGDDTLNGTPKADTIDGFDGDDIISGKAGNDLLDGGNGDDEVYGGPGNDEIKDNGVQFSLYNKVYGGSGNDNIDVGDPSLNGAYYVYGDAGDDFIEVLAHATIYGGPGRDTIYCTGYECVINGDGGNDVIHVEDGGRENTVSGGSGNDMVFGKEYIVSGNDGNDDLSMDWALELHGGKGDDVLEVLEPSYETYYNGGPGADTFRCSPGPGDIVEDYNAEEGDQIVNIEDCETVEGT